MLPMLGREVVEGQQRIAIFGQTLDRLVVFDAPGLDEGTKTPQAHPSWSRSSRSPAVRVLLSIAGSSAACSAHWRSCEPSSAGRGSWATFPRSPARIRAPRRQLRVQARSLVRGASDRGGV